MVGPGLLIHVKGSASGATRPARSQSTPALPPASRNAFPVCFLVGERAKIGKIFLICAFRCAGGLAAGNSVYEHEGGEMSLDRVRLQGSGKSFPRMTHSSPEGDDLDNLRLDKEGLGCFHINARLSSRPVASGSLGSFEHRSNCLFPKEEIYFEVQWPTQLPTFGLKVEILAGDS